MRIWEEERMGLSCNIVVYVLLCFATLEKSTFNFLLISMNLLCKISSSQQVLPPKGCFPP